jgi:UDP-arabinose 4-epimerase
MRLPSGGAASSSPTVIVTGGAGYIGSHSCKALAKMGFLPVTYDNLITGHEWAVRWGPLERGDILDGQRLREVIAAYRPSAVLHFAAFAYVGESVSAPGKYYRNNVVGTLTLLEAMRDTGINNIVFSSSCATYGTPERLPITEQTQQHPINPYGESKLVVERMLSNFERAHGLRWVALRYFNAAGADPEAEIGEEHAPETHLIPLVLAAASGRRLHVVVHGTDYGTADGTCVRDYVHVADLADAHVLGLRALTSGVASAAYNLGNGRGFTVREVIAEAERVTGLAVPVSFGPRRQGDPAVLVADSAKARRELRWEPRLPELSSIVGSAWAWHQQRP